MKLSMKYVNVRWIPGDWIPLFATCTIPPHPHRNGRIVAKGFDSRFPNSSKSQYSIDDRIFKRYKCARPWCTSWM